MKCILPAEKICWVFLSYLPLPHQGYLSQPPFQVTVSMWPYVSNGMSRFPAGLSSETSREHPQESTLGSKEKKKTGLLD